MLFLLVRLQAAYAAAQTLREDFDFLADLEAAVHQRAGDHGAETGHAEGAVDWQARPVEVWPQRVGGQAGTESLFQLREALHGGGADPQDGRLFQDGARKHRSQVVFDQVQPFRVVEQVDLGQDDHPALDLQDIEDRQVLAGLGHHAFVCGDHEQRGVDAAHTRQHVLDEVAVTGDIDDADLFSRGSIVRRGERKPGKSQVDGHLALAFLFQAVGVDASESLYQRGFAVVDVAGGADYAHSLAASPDGALEC